MWFGWAGAALWALASPPPGGATPPERERSAEPKHEAVAPVTPTVPAEEGAPTRESAPVSEPEVRAVVVKHRSEAGDRAAVRITRHELEERLPRSAPDALRGEPGVYVQQTAHAQGSPYLRGLTGQQTVMFFDGVRLNNSTFRQGPNQYFFTIDSRTIESLEVVRGSASTRYGSDALGGALLSQPITPGVAPTGKWVVHPRAMVRTATADAELGGRGQVEAAYGDKLGFLIGAGYRDVGQLRAGGRINAVGTGRPQGVPPAFLPDERTQSGTGFSEVTADTRLVWRPRRSTQLSLGYYDYRQLDAPRTDRCPAPTAPEDECLRYLQQFRTLVYLKAEHYGVHRVAESITSTLSYQNQHERRRLNRGSPSATQVNGEDDVHSVGGALKIVTHDWDLAPWAGLQVNYGADAYFDVIDSEGWLFFRDVQLRSDLSRGQYLDGGSYVTSGAWTEAVTRLGDAVRVRTGGRFALAHANADGDAASQSAAVDRTWATGVGGGGLTVQAVPWLSFVANVDQGFRAPNLDDLTSRQQTGPGFQFENPELGPEKSLSLEGGVVVEHAWVDLRAYAFQTRIRDLIGRAPRAIDACPDGEVGCMGSQTRFQLVNLGGRAILNGGDADLRVYFPLGFRLRGTVSYARGDAPNPIAAADNNEPARRPMSRVPPLNGLGEFGWRGHKLGLYAFGVVRWARAQTRLALADQSDARIPEGGTPGFAVFDLRVGYRLDPHLLAGVVFENLGNAAYRHHGSAINGPGRGLIANLEFGF